MKRLTDHKTAEALRHNAEGLTAKGFNVPIDDLRYIKLAQYEDEEERYLTTPKKEIEALVQEIGCVRNRIQELTTALQQHSELITEE